MAKTLSPFTKTKTAKSTSWYFCFGEGASPVLDALFIGHFQMHLRPLVAMAALLLTLRPSAPEELQPDELRACGGQLAATLSYLCNGKYNGPRQRRSGEVAKICGSKVDKPGTFVVFRFDADVPDGDEDVHFPFMAKSAAHTMLRRQKRNVVDECCRKPCTYDELRSYCG